MIETLANQTNTTPLDDRKNIFVNATTMLTKYSINNRRLRFERSKNYATLQSLGLGTFA